MESSLISEFIAFTDCDVNEAYIFLRCSKWDLKSAVDLWTERKNATSCKNYDQTEAKKFSRGISRATTNIDYLCEARNKLICDKTDNPFVTMNGLFVDSRGATFILPDFTVYPNEFQKFLEKDLIDNSTKTNLESAKRLNFWINKLPACMRLYPLSTSGDGNCLLHAVSLSMFGFHDRVLFLRQLEYEFLTQSLVMEKLKRRWRFTVHKTNLTCGVIYTENEWQTEWQQTVELASTKRKIPTQQGIYESLEEIHILALAHMLRRVVIVYSDVMLNDVNNQPFAPITLGGIYIPFECNSNECNKTPLLISYDIAHFSSLVFMEKNDRKEEENLYMAPLVDQNGQLLPIQFSIDPGENFNWEDKQACESLSLSHREQIDVLKQYLNVLDLNEADSEEESTAAEGDTFNRAAKQFQSIGKQFGSIGKSMGKKLRKNLGSSLSKLTSGKSKKPEDNQGKLYVAVLKVNKMPYHEEMTKNYLDYAQEKFMKEYLDQIPDLNRNDPIYRQAIEEGLLECTVDNCRNIATVYSSYLCLRCYNNHLKQYSSSQFGTGFRAEDAEKIRKLEDLTATLSRNLQDKMNIDSDNATTSNTATPYQHYEGLNVNQTAVEVTRQQRCFVITTRKHSKAVDDFFIGKNLTDVQRKKTVISPRRSKERRSREVIKTLNKIPTKSAKEISKSTEEPIKLIEDSPKSVKEPPKWIEELSKLVEELTKSIEEPPKWIEELQKLVEELMKSVEEPPNSVKETPNFIEKPLKLAKEPSKSIEEPPKLAEQLPKSAVESPKLIEEPPKSKTKEELSKNKEGDTSRHTEGK